jgi:hypothetical protein
MPITSAAHLAIWSDTHRAGVDLGPNNDRVPIGRQRNLKSRAKNKMAKWGLCIAGAIFPTIARARSPFPRCPLANSGTGLFYPLLA